MRILNSVYGDSSGGRWSATLKTGELLAAAGHQVTLLIAPPDLKNVPDYTGRDIDVVTLNNSGHYDLIASWKARRLIRDRKVDAVIAHSGRAIHMLKRAAPATVPVIAFNHSHNIRRTVKADAFFCITPYMKQIVDAATGGSKPSFVISNAVSIPPDEALTAGIADRPFTIGFIGRMALNKDLPTLIDAAGVLAQQGVEFRVLLAGEGEERPILERKVDELAIRDKVVFAGWVGPARKADFFNDCDVICSPSEWDTQPLTVLEALAWGKALVGTDIPGPSSCYEHENTALVVPPKDPLAMAAAFVRLKDNPELRTRLGANGRRQAMAEYADAEVGGLLDRRVKALVELFARGKS